jgi:hypothetical protein
MHNPGSGGFAFTDILHQVVDVAANVDLGVSITVGQLLQLHPFLHQVQILCFYCE